MNENQAGVILEEVRDMFKTLAGGQKIIENRLDKMDERFDGIDKRFDSMDERMDRIEIKLDSVVQYTAQIAENVTDHENRIAVLERRPKIKTSK